MSETETSLRRTSDPKTQSLQDLALDGQLEGLDEPDPGLDELEQLQSSVQDNADQPDEPGVPRAELEAVRQRSIERIARLRQAYVEMVGGDAQEVLDGLVADIDAAQQSQ